MFVFFIINFLFLLIIYRQKVTFMRTEFNIYEEDQDDSSPRDYIVKIKNDFDSIQNALTAFKTRVRNLNILIFFKFIKK